MGEPLSGAVRARRRPIVLRSLLSRALVGGAAVTALLIVLVVGVVHAERTHAGATRWAQHSARVLDAAELAEREVVDLETGVRGYAATDQRLFLAPWYAALHALPPQLAELRRLVADNPGQARRITRLTGAVEDYISNFTVPFLHRPRRLRGTPLLRFMLTGKHRLDAMRGQFATFDNVERRLQATRDRRSENADLVFVWLSIAAGTLMVLSLASFIWFVISRVVLPLRRTVEACARTVDGRPGAALTIGGASELVALGTAFDRMLEQLHDRERERRAAADQIAEMLRLQQTVIDSAHHAYVAFDERGIITAVNPAAERTFGLTSAQAVGQPVLDLIAERERDGWRQEMRRFRKSGEGDRLGRLLETTGCRADGSEFPAEATVTVARHRGRPTFHAFISDITERIARQRDLSLMASIVEGTEDAILTESADGAVISWNRGAELLYGYPAEEMIGQPISRLVPPERAGEDLELLQRALSGEPVTRLETVRLRRDGRRLNVAYTVSPLYDGDDVIVGASIIARDMTERHRMEDELRTSREQALEASRLKSEFVANMSHEIRTPLNGVVSMTELLLETPLTGDQRDYAQVALTSGEALMRVINDILDFSKIEAGKLDILAEDFSLRAAVDEVAEILGVKAAERGIALDVEVGEGVPEIVRGDGNRVRQVLMNLVSNAVKFTSQGGVTVSVAHDGSSLRFSVRDTGIGIDPERIEALFEPFSQEDATTTRRYGGTGLGLCISKQLVELMGGEIGCESVSGHGSTFHFTLPCVPGEGTDAAGTSADLTGMRMLVVAAAPEQRHELVSRLASWGITPDSADDHRETVPMMRSAADSGRPYQAALVDRELPEADGLELAGEIRAAAALRATRLILLTAAPVDPGQLRAAGVDAQLITPVRQSRLYNQLLATLRRGRGRGRGRGDAAPATPAAGAPAEPGRTRLRVLVAEDNEVNQFAAIRLLQTFGLTVDIARNGREAITMTGRRDYDAVFMDCQMPEIDGFTAARTIRAREQESGKRLPIIALTANALEGDRERCLAAGMDDYVPKPLRLQTIEELIGRIPGLRGAGRAGAAESDRSAPAPGGPAPEPAAPVLDPEALVELRDPVLAAELAELFIEQSAARVPALREAVEAPDPGRVADLAHALRGSAATVGAQRMSELAEQLCEIAARGAIDVEARELAQRLDAVRQDTEVALRSHLATRS